MIINPLLTGMILQVFTSWKSYLPPKATPPEGNKVLLLLTTKYPPL